MKKFLVLLMAPTASFDAAMKQPTPEMQKGMQAWETWMKKNKSAITYNGGPVGKTKRIDSKGVNSVRNEVGGFLVVEASSHDEAVKLFVDNPHMSMIPGAWAEVIEVMPMSGM